MKLFAAISLVMYSSISRGWLYAEEMFLTELTNGEDQPKSTLKPSVRPWRMYSQQIGCLGSYATAPPMQVFK